MEFKHFSHNHSLIYQQLPQGREIKCSGCKSPGSGSVYVCWQCSYFLHEQCFRAKRSLNHPSHPLHPLTLVPYPTYPSNSIYCNTCSLIGNGFSYCCSECEFDLHIHCALAPAATIHQSHPQATYPITNHFTPPNPQIYQPVQSNFNTNFSPPVSVIHNQAPPPPPPTAATIGYVPNAGIQQSTSTPGTSHQPQQNNPLPVYPQPSATLNIPLTGYNQPKPDEIKHFSHTHGLKQAEFQKQDGIKCSGCEYAIDGSGYSCVERNCDFHLDKQCFESPTEVRHKSHLDHPLTLLAKPSYEGGQFTCNACLKNGSGFVYNCSKCSFDLHADCISWPETVKREDHKHPLTLFYASPTPKAEGTQEVTFACDVCQGEVHDMAWTYYCHECDFGTHLECVISQVRQAEISEEQLIAETALKLKVLQLLLSGRGDILL